MDEAPAVSSTSELGTGDSRDELTRLAGATGPVLTRWALAVVAAALGSGMAFLDGSVVNVALPAIGRELGGGFSVLQWVLDGYLLSLSALCCWRRAGRPLWTPPRVPFASLNDPDGGGTRIRSGRRDAARWWRSSRRSR